MTDTDDLSLARAAFDALAERGVDAMLAYVDPGFEMETPAAIAMEPQVYSGHEGLRRYFDSFYDAMDTVVIEPQEIEPLEPGRVFIHFRVRTRGRASGIQSEMDARAVATLREGLLQRLDFILPGEPSPAPSG